MTLRHRRKLHHISVGRPHRHKRVLILVADLDVRVIDEDGVLLRHFELDPTRDYQARSRSSLWGFVCPRNGETSHWWARGDLNPHILSNTGT